MMPVISLPSGARQLCTIKKITMILGLLLSLLALVFAWLLWAPLRLEIDSVRGVYRLAWVPLAAAEWQPDKGLDVVEIRMLFFRKVLALSQMKSSRSKPAQAKATGRLPAPRPAKPSRLSFAQVRKLVISLLRTFRLRRCRIWWDSDDFVLNAWLFPLAYWLKNEAAAVYVNFQGRRDLVLLLENRMGRLLWILVKFFIFNKKR